MSKERVKGCPSAYDVYSFYRDNSESPVSRKEYSRIIKECNQEVLTEVVNNSNDFEVPYRMGIMSVIKYSRVYGVDKRRWAVDFKKTKEVGFKVFFDQEYIYKWRWLKTNAIVKGKSKYKFTASRQAKRLVPRALSNKVDFYKVR